MQDFSYDISDYDFHLPQELIAQQPATERDQSRLLILDTVNKSIDHHRFTDIAAFFKPDDLLVVNNTKVFPARLIGRKPTGGKVELFLLEFPRQTVTKSPNMRTATAPALLKSSKRPKIGSILHFSDSLQARVDNFLEDGKAQVTLLYPDSRDDLESILTEHGRIPLPPYIERINGTTKEDVVRYQTVYAGHTGSVAAPTAGLHFSEPFLQSISQKGIRLAQVTLHVGYGTFAPVRVTDIRDHQIHREHFTITEETAKAVKETKEKGGRVWAVGTTTVRTLEYAADEQGTVGTLNGECDLFIYPGYQFKVVDNLITNFHLPKSSLLFLVSALAGRENILAAYNEAVKHNYRFFSYGDAMAIITKQ